MIFISARPERWINILLFSCSLAGRKSATGYKMTIEFGINLFREYVQAGTVLYRDLLFSEGKTVIYLDHAANLAGIYFLSDLSDSRKCAFSAKFDELFNDESCIPIAPVVARYEELFAHIFPAYTLRYAVPLSWDLWPPLGKRTTLVALSRVEGHEMPIHDYRQYIVAPSGRFLIRGLVCKGIFVGELGHSFRSFQIYEVLGSNKFEMCHPRRVIGGKIPLFKLHTGRLYLGGHDEYDDTEQFFKVEHMDKNGSRVTEMTSDQLLAAGYDHEHITSNFDDLLEAGMPAQLLNLLKGSNGRAVVTGGFLTQIIDMKQKKNEDDCDIVWANNIDIFVDGEFPGLYVIDDTFVSANVPDHNFSIVIGDGSRRKSTINMIINRTYAGFPVRFMICHSDVQVGAENFRDSVSNSMDFSIVSSVMQFRTLLESKEVVAYISYSGVADVKGRILRAKNSMYQNVKTSPARVKKWSGRGFKPILTPDEMRQNEKLASFPTIVEPGEPIFAPQVSDDKRLIRWGFTNFKFYGDNDPKFLQYGPGDVRAFTW